MYYTYSHVHIFNIWPKRNIDIEILIKQKKCVKKVASRRSYKFFMKSQGTDNLLSSHVTVKICLFNGQI